jgi:hypothetical protein
MGCGASTGAVATLAPGQPTVDRSDDLNPPETEAVAVAQKREAVDAPDVPDVADAPDAPPGCIDVLESQLGKSPEVAEVTVLTPVP